jgi:hypothetical protein
LPSGDLHKLRDTLLSELARLDSPEALALWAQRTLPLKNQLSAKDAQALEDAFKTRLSQLNETEPLTLEGKPADRNNHSRRVEPAKRTVTVINKPVRGRDRHHLKFLASQPCLVCGRTPSDAHHIKFAEQRAMGRKVSDRFTVPVCRLHHGELHRRGNERVWWHALGIDPLKIAAALWDQTQAATSDDAIDAGVNEEANGYEFIGQMPNGEAKPIHRQETE